MRKTQKIKSRERNVLQRLLSLALGLVMCAQMLPVTVALGVSVTSEEAAAEEEKKSVSMQNVYNPFEVKNVKSYQELKAKLDADYQPMYTMMLFFYRYSGHFVDDGNDYGLVSSIFEDIVVAPYEEKFKSDPSFESEFGFIQAYYMNLFKEDILAIIESRDSATGKPCYELYAKDLKTELTEVYGDEVKDLTDLSDLFAAQAANLIAGEWRIKELPWKVRGGPIGSDGYTERVETTISATVACPLADIENATEGSGAILLRDFYGDMLLILREMAWRTSGQEVVAKNSNQIFSNQDLLDCLQLKVQEKLSKYCAATDKWATVGTGTFSKKEEVQPYIKPAIYALSEWRTAQDAYNLYLADSAKWETWPGIAQSEFLSYQAALKDYQSWHKTWNHAVTLPGDVMVKAEKRTAYDVYNADNKKYKAAAELILNSLLEEPLEQQIQQAQSSQKGRISPYSDKALAALEEQGTDIRTHLRLQLAELRVWNTVLKRATGSIRGAATDWFDYEFKTYLNEEGDLPGFYLQGRLAYEEIQQLSPLISQYLQEAEKQFKHYNYQATFGKDIEIDIPTTTRSPEEMQELIAAKESELNELESAVAAAQQELDDCITYLGTNSDQYRECQEALNLATRQLSTAQKEYAELQTELVYACLNVGNKLIDDANREEGAYDTYLTALKQAVIDMGGDPDNIPDDRTDKDDEDDEEPVARDSYSRTLKDYQEAVLNLRDVEEFFDSSLDYKPFPEFSLLTEKELKSAIGDYQQELDEIFTDIEAQYSSLKSAYQKYAETTELLEKAWQYQNVMTLAQTYLSAMQRIEDLKTAIVQAENAVKRMKPPTSEDEAVDNFKELFLQYYYAEREYLEFQELEMKLLGGEEDVLSFQTTYGKLWTAIYDYKPFSAELNEIKNDLNNQLEQLKANYDALSIALWGDSSKPNDKTSAAYYLSLEELSKDVQMSGSELRTRVKEIDNERTSAKERFEAIKKSLKVLDELDYDKEALKDFIDIYSDGPFHLRKRLAVLSGLEENEDVLRFLALGSNTAYIEAYLDYAICEARLDDPNGIRDSILERLEITKDDFALQVDTGANPGTGKILFFSVDYLDTEGFERKEYIFPNIDAEVKTTERIGELTSTTEYINQNHVDTMAELGQSGSDADSVESLDSWSTDTFMFTTQYEIAENGILAFEAFGENVHAGQDAEQVTADAPADEEENGDAPMVAAAEVKNSWSCRGMRLYHVDDVFGESVYGYGGSDETRTKLEFIGQQIGALRSSGSSPMEYDISWSCDKMLTFDEKSGEFAIDRNTYLYRTEKLGTGSAAGKVDKKSDEESEYLFKLDFADVYGAGIEPLVTRCSDNSDSQSNGRGEHCRIQDLGLAECLVYTLVYYDSNNCRHLVRVPVVTSSLAWAVDHGIDKTDSVFGYAQQGDSLVFSAYLPDMQSISLEESYLRFEAVDGWDASSKATALSKQHIDSRISMLQSSVSREKTLSDGTRTTVTESRDAEIRLTGMQIYKPGTYSASVMMDNGVIKPSVEGSPAYYFVSATASGEAYSYGKNVYLTNLLDSYTAGTKLKPDEDGKKYMVIISTDFTSLSATMESPTVSVEYVSNSGRVVTSVAEDVATVSHDYYGYWPGMNNEDITSEIATGQSGQLKMLFDINDLNYFSKIKISMDSTARDDWQITKVEIMKIDSFGERVGKWEPVKRQVSEAILSDRTYDRALSGEILLTKEATVLIQPGDTKEIIIHGDNAEVEEQEDINWEEERYYMDLDTAMSDLGFSKERANYTVKVKVAGESDSNTVDGDCGSTNPFYFQLVFANGKSGYVLANQQLSGDGFRTGYSETFTVCTNRNYGELKSVRIIPDDMSSNSDTFDKLNIDSIEVSRQSNEAVNRTWVVSNVGWIEFDYHDEAEAYSVSGRQGRAEGNIARNFNVSYATYSTKLLFALGTLEPDSNVDNIEELLEGEDSTMQKAISEALTAKRQFQGEVSLNLTYRDTKGNVQHQTFDLVQALAAYANKKLNTHESTVEKGNIDQSENTSDTSYMFRMDHIDRFELEVRDAVRLLNASIIATGVSDQSCFWKIGSFAVSMITEPGMLNINSSNEYEKTNAASAIPVTKATGLPYTMWIPARHTEEFQFYFEENEISVDLEEETWEVAASRIPDSDNDVANIYVYLTDDSSMPDALMVQARYANSHGLSYQSAQREMLPMADGKGFYAGGIDVGGMAVLNSLFLDTLDAGTKNVTIDHIVIQQIRSDVVINTYTCYFEGTDGSLANGGTLRVYPGGTTNQGGDIGYDENKQVLTIGFGDDTETARLVAENRDIAVAIRYTTTNDSSAREYNSPYIYLTDQQIRAIAAGSTAQITFHEPYVDKIRGIVLLATGKLKAELQNACVGVYVKDEISDADKCIRWYSFGSTTDGIPLNASAQTITPSADSALETVKNKLYTVCPLKVTFKTGSLDTAAGLQTTDPIKMEVSYVDAEGNNRTKTFADIRNMLIEGGFGAGEEATVRVMLMGVKELRSIKVYPYSANTKETSTGNWYVASLSLELNLATSLYQYSSPVERSASQEEPLEINARSVALKIEAKTRIRNADGDEIVHSVSSAAGPISLTVKAGQSVTLIPALTGTEKGYFLQAIRQSDGFDVTNDATVLKKVSDTYVFVYAGTSLATAETYRLTFTSVEDSTVSETVTITVSSSGSEPEIPVTPQTEDPFGIQYFNEVTQKYEIIHDVTLYVGDELPLRTSTVKAGNLTWESVATEVATVSKNDETVIIAAVEVGTAVITATDGNGKKETCTVHVNERPAETGG